MLTLSVPNFRQHLSSAFFFFIFYFNKLSFGKTFICKVERQNVKQRRSRWDGSLSRLIWIYAVCKSLLLSPVAAKELNVSPYFIIVQVIFLFPLGSLNPFWLLWKLKTTKAGATGCIWGDVIKPSLTFSEFFL